MRLTGSRTTVLLLAVVVLVTDLVSTDQDSAATDVSCAAGSCLAVGRLGDRLAAWTSMPAPAGEQRQVGIDDGKVSLLLRPTTGPQAVYARSSG